jgi:hypothetical protein
MSLILLNNLQILNLNCQTIRISWGSSVTILTNVKIGLEHQEVAKPKSLPVISNLIICFLIFFTNPIFLF